MGYTFAQLEGFAAQGGFPPNTLSTMAAIAMAESGGANVKQQGQPYNLTGWGLWQITPGNKLPSIGVDAELFDPVKNARAAFAVWRTQGYGAWTVWKTGAYRKFMQGGVTPDTSGAVLGSDVPGGGPAGVGAPAGPTPAAGLLDFLTNGGMWARIGAMLLGGIMVLFGLWKLSGIDVLQTAIGKRVKRVVS